jgi:hypothetical protein
MLICWRLSPQMMNPVIHRWLHIVHFDVINGLIHWWIHNFISIVRRWWKLSEIGPSWRMKVTGCKFLGAISCPQSLSTPWLPWGDELEELPSTRPFNETFCLNTSSETQAAGHGLKPLKPWAKTKLSTLDLVFSGVCHSNKSVSNTDAFYLLNVILCTNKAFCKWTF